MKQLFQTQCPAARLLVLVCAIALVTGCKQQSYNGLSYDLRHPVKDKLGKVLNEISGINFNTDNNTLLAIADSKEKVIQIDYNKRKLKDYTGDVVPKKSDIEDVVKLDSSIYLLSSKGIIYEVRQGSADTARSYQLQVDGKNDFETLYYDPSAKGLVMVCKECKSDDEDTRRNAFRFDLQTKQFYPEPFYSFNPKAVEKMLNGGKAKFNPSAAAINPIDKKLYILSSAGNLLVIADTKGNVEKAFKLEVDEFPQAEGIAFAPNGDMFISNEGKLGAATLQIFKYKPPKTKTKK